MKKITLKNDMLITTALETIDYSDCFTADINKEEFTSIDNFVLKYFQTQPSWLRAISMNILTQKQMDNALKNNDFSLNSNVGAWKVYLRNDKEIVFGDDMGFMEYRFSMRLDEKQLRVATVVQYKGRFGKYYFAVIKLLHQKFVLLSLSYPLQESKEKTYRK